MVAVDEFIPLPYTPDLTKTGVVYACKRITRISVDDKNDPIHEIRLLVSQTIVELAIKKYLRQNKIPHYYTQLMHFSDPDHMILTIGGRRCVICNTIISNKRKIREIRTIPSTLLDHPITISEDLLRNQLFTDDDIFIFTIFLCLITSSRQDCLRAKQAKEPIYQVSLLPPPWSESKNPASIGNLACKCQYPEDLSIQIGATDSNQHYLTKTIEIKSGKATINLENFSKIYYLGTENIPIGKVSLESDILNSTITILPWDWRNIWFYGLGILLVGFITCGNLIDQVHVIQNKNNLSHSSSFTKGYLSIPFTHLSPMEDLFNQAMLWSK